MSNGGQGRDGGGGWLQVFMLLQRGGRGAAIGIFIGGVGLMGLGVTSSISFKSPLAGAQSFCQGVIAMGLAVGLYSVAAHAKASTDLYVASEAEKRIVNPDLPAASSLAPIQREIAKQIAADPAKAAEAARHTPPVGTETFR